MKHITLTIALLIVITGCSSANRTTTTTTGAAGNPDAAPVTVAAPAAPAVARAEPTVAPQVKVEVGSYRMVKDSIGILHGIGYVLNNGNVAVTNIQVALSLLDASGTTVGAEKAIYMRETLPVGERSPFLTQFTTTPPAWSSEKLQVQAEPYRSDSPAASRVAQGLASEDVTGTFNQTRFASRYAVSGQVRNGGAAPAQFVSIIGLVLDADDAPLGVGQTYSKLDQVDPGQTAPFSLDVSVEGAPASYEIYVQGRKK